MGKEPYGVMVVADGAGLLKSAYRKFKIKPEGIKTNDDYAMMAQVKTEILDNFLKGIQEDKLNVRGLVFVGVMVQ